MYLASTGMVCSVGLHAAATCAAMRAGLARFAEVPFRHTGGQLVIGASVPGLAAPFEDAARLPELLGRAVSECIGTRPAETLKDLPLLVALAEPERPGGGAGQASSMIAQVERRL